MTLICRPARPRDHDAMTALLLDAARARASDLWRGADGAGAQVRARLGDADSPIWTRWLVAEAGDVVVGAAHVIRVPVPPIYAAPFGAPGLILQNGAVAPHAPAGTQAALHRAAEACLRTGGARVILAAGTEVARGYEPLTLYYAKHPPAARAAPSIRAAGTADLPLIAAASADSRRTLERLHPAFWAPHADAAARFGAWMARSLTLEDRDMFAGDAGYAISQPVTRLHVPAAFDARGIGIIDDFHHPDMDSPEAEALLAAAEAARARRGDRAVLAVCPADWTAKRQVLKRAGYAPALVWGIKSAE